MGDAALDSSLEDYEVIPDDAPHTVGPFQRCSHSCSPFSYLSRVLPGAFKRKNAEPPPQPPQQPKEKQTEQHSGEETDMVELQAVAMRVCQLTLGFSNMNTANKPSARRRNAFLELAITHWLHYTPYGQSASNFHSTSRVSRNSSLL